jgi:hypothetical protein
LPFKITATDSQGPSHIIPLQYYVFDYDSEQTPRTVYNFSIIERTNIGGFLGVNATTGMLYIKKEGLSISVIVDAKLSLKVRVTDNGPHHAPLSAITTFDIAIKNTNDAPRFPCPLIEACGTDRCVAKFTTEAKIAAFAAANPACVIKATENTVEDSLLGDIVPTDQESDNTLGLNQTLSFKLNFLDTGDFSISSVFDWTATTPGSDTFGRWVGRLRLTKNSLDFERKKFYLVEVNARDDGLIGVLGDKTNETTGEPILDADGNAIRELVRVRGWTSARARVCVCVCVASVPFPYYPPCPKHHTRNAIL